MAKNGVSVSSNFCKAVAKRVYMRECIKRKRQNKEFREKKSNAKRQKRSENIEEAREYEKQTVMVKASFQSRTYQRTEQKSIEPFKESYAELKAKPNGNLSWSRLHDIPCQK